MTTEKLRWVSQGPEVEAWQRFLNTFVEAGALKESCKLVVNGKFGTRTRFATMMYQIRERILLSRDNGGDGIGIVGPITQNHALRQGFPPLAFQQEQEEAPVKSRRTAG